MFCLDFRKIEIHLFIIFVKFAKGYIGDWCYEHF